MKNEDRERRDNRPNSASQVPVKRVLDSHASVDRRPMSLRADGQGVSRGAVAAAATKKKPVHLSREEVHHLQLNPSDIEEVLPVVNST